MGLFPPCKGSWLYPWPWDSWPYLWCFIGKTICVCLDHILYMIDFQLPLTWHLLWSIVYWKCFSPSEGKSVQLLLKRTHWDLRIWKWEKLLQTFNVIRIEKAHLNDYYIEVLKFKNHCIVHWIEESKLANVQFFW